MLNIGLVGYGFMGHMHLENYVRMMREGMPIQVAAICDVRIDELKHEKVEGNISTETDTSPIDLSVFRLYKDLEDMLQNEKLDVIDITLPTDLHADIACNLLQWGYHVFCEKPMAINSDEAARMAETARTSRGKLMIGQCLRFWPAYVYLKETVDSGRFGQATGGYFFRGSEAPKGWLLQAKRSGGALLDMHIHDSDVIQWIFGMPEQVSTIARSCIPGSGYDIASTHYHYEDGKVLNAQVDWTLEGDFGFSMTYRVNFEKGNLVFENGKVKVHPSDAPGFVAELSDEMGYYPQLRYFLERVMNGEPIRRTTPESALLSVRLVEAEMLSASRNGEKVALSNVPVRSASI